MNTTRDTQATPSKKPTSPVAITAILSAFTAVAAPATAFIYNHMELQVQTDKQKHEMSLQNQLQEHEIQIERQRQEHEIQISFLREIEKSCVNTAYRRDLLSFYSEVHPDDGIRNWALTQQKMAQQLLEAKAKLSPEPSLEQVVSKVAELEKKGAPAQEVKKAKKQASDLTSAKKDMLRLEAEVHGKRPDKEDLEDLEAAEAAQQAF